jgi:hypothetical protein
MLKDMPEKVYPRKQGTAAGVFPEKPEVPEQAARGRTAGADRKDETVKPEEERYGLIRKTAEATGKDRYGKPEKHEETERGSLIRKPEEHEEDEGKDPARKTAEEMGKDRYGKPEEPDIQKPRTAPGKKLPDKVTIADSFSPRADSVIEKLGVRKEEDDMRSIIKSKPIHSLSEAIGINDKFLFVRELFQGDPGKYTRAISALENSSGFEEARKMILNFAGNDEENEAARQLIDLVKRKFSADE